MKISIVGFFLLGISFSALAQTDSTTIRKNRIRYFNNFLAGGLLGDDGQGTGFSISTTHGIRINRLALGAGVGYDSYYDWRVVPFFGSISYDFARIKSNAFYIQFNTGYSHAERVRREEWLTDYRDYGSKMISTVIGYRITTNKLNIYLAAGHKYQKANFSYNGLLTWSSFAGPGSLLATEETMNRVVVQIGFGLH
jgi:hypothetical protein